MTCQEIYKKSHNEQKALMKLSSSCGQKTWSLLSRSSPQLTKRQKPQEELIELF